MVRILIALVILGHGVGHSLGILQTLKVATVNPAWDGESWALTRLAGPSLTQAVGLLLWAVAIVGFVAVTAILAGWLPTTWWQPLVIVATAASLAGLVIFPAAFPITSTIGALVVDVAMLVAVFGMHWQPTDTLP